MCTYVNFKMVTPHSLHNSFLLRKKSRTEIVDNEHEDKSLTSCIRPFISGSVTPQGGNPRPYSYQITQRKFYFQGLRNKA